MLNYATRQKALQIHRLARRQADKRPPEEVAFLFSGAGWAALSQAHGSPKAAPRKTGLSLPTRPVGEARGSTIGLP
ncbi:hypothetical protein, partial [Melaminivora alkalimesophila]|uniref:hypothetical protein n=1 Tax=Melaminivora alkalimesophila TaxID=1165852 RepID=UPI0019D3765E